MSNRGEWIDFAELCARVKTSGLNKSPRTLRRYIKQKLISCRQAGRGCRVEFNWKTVERELRAFDAPGVHALALVPESPDLAGQVAELRTLMHCIARKLGVDPEMFGGEQRRTGT